LGGDFNVYTTTLPDTIDTSDLYELLQAPKLVQTEQPSVVTTRQNRDASVGDWGRKLLDLCCDVGFLIFNGRTHGDESREFTCLANGGRSVVNYILGSPTVCVATPLWPSVGVKPNTCKVRDLESSGTPECSELDNKAQNTLHRDVLGVIGKGLET
jgi:hypothetical protein